MHTSGTVALALWVAHPTAFQANSDIKYWWAFALLCVVLAYFIANFFTSIYETAIDTIFLCYVAEDNVNLAGANSTGESTMRVSHADPDFDVRGIFAKLPVMKFSPLVLALHARHRQRGRKGLQD